MAVPETLFAPLAALADRLAGARVLVLASSQRHVAALRAALPGRDVAVFDGARVHVPVETVEAATAALAASGADTIVAIGGGSPIGLGKALRLTHDVRFVAVPTTYAGSEMTRLYGITRGRDKQTGKDERVRPDLVLYDVALTTTMPLALSVQSLMNAIAHVASALSTGSIPTDEGLAAVHAAALAIGGVVAAPEDVTARSSALRAASACAALIDRGKAGMQHALAHLLGGAFDLDHAALHAVLLPHFLAHVARTDPELGAALDAERLATRLRGQLAAAGAPTTLGALGVTRGALDAVLATRPEIPVRIAQDAL